MDTKVKTTATGTNEEARERSSRARVTAPESAAARPPGAFGAATLQHAAGNLAVQRAARPAAASPDDGLARRIRGASGGGSRLDRATQRALEASLGTNLPDVRLHTDGEADRMARAVDAEAFTSGSHIFFRGGAYSPSSERGMRLLAHEAAHVVQQAEGAVAGTPAPGGISLSHPEDRFEQAAARAADAVIAGVPARPRNPHGSHPGKPRAEEGAAGRIAGAAASPAVPAVQRNGPNIPPNINPYGPTVPAPSPVPPSGPTPLAPPGPQGPPIPKAPPVPNIPEPPPGGFPQLPPSPATGAAAGEAGAAATVDLAGVATSAAAVIIPLATAVVIGYGLYQASKLTQAAVEAVNAGVAARRKAKTAAAGFAHVMTGGKSKGDEGSIDADNQILAIMAKTNASREQVVDAVSSQQGGYTGIYQKNLKRMQDHLYAEAVRIFEESHQADFGIIESFGETWGMRGRFRTDLRLVLYAED